MGRDVPTEDVGADSRALVVLAFFLVIGGRFSLDRVGVQIGVFSDLRVIVAAVLVLVTAIRHVENNRLGAVTGPVPGRWLATAYLFFSYQCLSAFWAPPGARLGAGLLDITVLACTLCITAQLIRVDPHAAVALLMRLFVLTGCVYFLGATLGIGREVSGRYSAFTGGPNVFVRIMVIAGISAFGLFFLTHRWTWIVPVPMFLAGAVLSGSRGGLVAAVIAVGLASVLYLPRIRLAPLVTITLVAITVGVAYWAYAGDAVRSVATQRLVDETLKQHYSSGRSDIFQQSIDLFGEHPVLGTGLDGYYADEGRFQPAEYQYPHDLLLAVAAEGGTVGLALLSVTAMTFVAGVRRPRGRRHSPETAVFGLSFVFAAVAGLFSGDYYDNRFAWVFALVTLMLVEQGKGAAADRRLIQTPRTIRAREPGARSLAASGKPGRQERD